MELRILIDWNLGFSFDGTKDSHLMELRMLIYLN